ncbi:MAG: diphthine--ammonia ligase [Ignavibacteriae bacterium]|nr:diphthine--ammonia ligase [Ignavibacteriota bacterium]
MSKRAFCLWSGGKDSHLALQKALDEGYNVELLLTFFDARTRLSLSHGLPARLLHDQAELLGIYLQEAYVTREEYGPRLGDIMLSLVPQGIEHAVFGDIYLEEHKTWNERVCAKSGITPLFPLWGKSIDSIVDAQRTLQSVIVSVDRSKIDRTWLGKEIDDRFREVLAKGGLDFCGEKGEYHTLVAGSPLMNGCLQLERWKERVYDSYVGLDALDWSVMRKTNTVGV